MYSIFGLSTLGSMRNYRLVNYRVYVPRISDNNMARRQSIRAVTRLGSFAVLSSLYSETRNSNSSNSEIKLSLGFIVPVTLLTDFDSEGKKILELIERKDCKKAYSIMAQKIVENLQDTIRIKYNILNYIIEKIYNYTINTQTVIPHKLDKCNIPSINIEKCTLPLVTGTTCKTHLKILENNSEDSEYTKLDLYLAFVPLTMASRFNDKNTIVLYREEHTSDVAKWNIAFDTTISYSISRMIRSMLENSINNGKKILFIDTTHGVNTLVSALSRNEHIIWASALLEEPKNLYLLRYNSDPFPLRPLKKAKNEDQDISSFNTTLDYNMSYYYSLIEYQSIFNILRSKIDELIEMVKNNRLATDNKIVKRALLTLYLVKLGLLPWAIASMVMNKQQITIDPYIISLSISRNNNVVNVNYRVKDHEKHAYEVLLEIYYNLVYRELKGLYNVIRCDLCNDECRNLSNHCFDNNKAICISLRKMKKLLDEIKSSRIEKNYLIGYFVEPSMRIILVNELEDYKDNIHNKIKYLFPKAFANTEISCQDLVINEVGIEHDDSKVYCFTPPSQLRITDKAVRNFIAHAGLTRLTKGIGVVISTKNNEKSGCKAECICISKPIDVEDVILDKFMNLLL